MCSRYTDNCSMVKGQNTCQWLVLSSTESCARRCLGSHCKIHLARLRQGPGTYPCGKGVINRFKLCQTCGYHWVQVRIWQHGHRAFIAEFRRLAAMDSSNQTDVGDGIYPIRILRSEKLTPFRHKLARAYAHPHFADNFRSDRSC